MEKNTLQQSFFSGVLALARELKGPTLIEFFGDCWKFCITILIASSLILSIDVVISNIAKVLLYGFR
jgi:hypothetical protein